MRMDSADNRCAIVACVAAIVLSAGSLSAQDRPVRPLFGGAYAATEQLLMLTGRFGTGVSRGDRIALTPDVDPTEPHRALSPFLNGDGTLAYTVGRNWFDFDASVTSSTRYYSDEQRTETLNSGRVGLALQKRTARTTVATDLRVSRDPVSVLALLPQFQFGGASNVPLDYEVGAARSVLVRQIAAVELTRTFSPRSSVTFEYRGERGALATWDNDRWRNGVRGFYRRRFTQGLSMRLGYGYERFTTEEQLGELMRSRPIQGHWFDVGVDYSRDATINLTRRTTLSFDMGTKMLADIDRRRFDVVGSAVLHREIGRTWSAALAYNRNFGFVDVLAYPASTQAITGDLSGRLGRYVRMSSDVGASRGQVGSSADQGPYSAYRASAGMTVDMTAALGLGVRYSYIRFQFDDPSILDTFARSALTRQTLSVNLELTAPLYARTRR